MDSNQGTKRKLEDNIGQSEACDVAPAVSGNATSPQSSPALSEMPDAVPDGTPDPGGNGTSSPGAVQLILDDREHDLVKLFQTAYSAWTAEFVTVRRLDFGDLMVMADGEVIL